MKLGRSEASPQAQVARKSKVTVCERLRRIGGRMVHQRNLGSQGLLLYDCGDIKTECRLAAALLS
jgi:hypothetical protein